MVHYPNIEDYLRANCTRPQVILSQYELEQLPIRHPPFNHSFPNNTIFYCFCNKDQYEIPMRTQLFLDKHGIRVQLYQNLLDIIDKIKQQELVAPEHCISKRNHNLVLVYLNEKEK